MSDVFDYYRRRARAKKAKAQARDAKSVADQVKEGVDEAKADAEKVLKSSRGMSLMVYAALGTSLVVTAMNFIGPLQITRKLPR